MPLFENTTKSLLAALTLGGAVAGVYGCSAKPVEATGSSHSKLLAPKAVYKALASDATRKALGIAEWRVFRGKTSFVLTGYDAQGKAVKGVSVEFDGQTPSAKPKVVGKLLDGSRFSAHHEYGGGSKSNALLAQSSKAFIDRAINDMTSLQQQLHSGTKKTRLGAQCSGDMVAVMASALQCLVAAGVNTTTPNKAAVLQCIQAAVTAAATASSCQDTGTTGSTGTSGSSGSSGASGGEGSSGSSGASGGEGSSGSGGGEGSSGSSGSGGDESSSGSSGSGSQDDADKAQDKAQDKQDDADQKQDQEQDAEDAKSDSKAGDDAQSTSEGQDCTSCAGTGGDDIQTNDQTGDVQTADSGGEAGGDTG
ncbi:hypothetical protein BH11MYX4_BH11MYX4_54840 [soil metagenome]